MEQITSNIAKNLKRLREEAGRRQEDVALAARRCGFGWQRSTVAMLESHRYELKATELLALPKVLLEARVGDFTLAALMTGPPLPPHKGRGRRWVPVAVTDRLGLDDESDLRRLLNRKASTAGWSFMSIGMGPGDEPNEAERKAARRLGEMIGTTVDPWIVRALARALWDRTLEEERDARVAEAAPAGASARVLQAKRAHETRRLLAEMAGEAAGAAGLEAALTAPATKEN